MAERRPDKYKLIGRLAVPVADLMEWASWFESADRRVARTQVGPLVVSTVFVGIDHNYGDSGDPLLFEPMVFGAHEGHEMDEGWVDRCSTWGEAEKMHARGVEWAREQIAKADAALSETRCAEQIDSAAESGRLSKTHDNLP